MFRRIKGFPRRIDGEILTRVLNMDEMIRKILGLLGTEYEKIFS